MPPGKAAFPGGGVHVAEGDLGGAPIIAGLRLTLVQVHPVVPAVITGLRFAFVQINPIMAAVVTRLRLAFVQVNAVVPTVVARLWLALRYIDRVMSPVITGLRLALGHIYTAIVARLWLALGHDHVRPLLELDDLAERGKCQQRHRKEGDCHKDASLHHVLILSLDCVTRTVRTRFRDCRVSS